MIHHGDLFDVLPTLEAESIHACVTDPPYGLSFMGKRWDYDVPSVEMWQQVLRVLKPGAHLLAFSGPRTYHRMAVNIEDSGFEIRDCLAWIFGQGFPKSKNLGDGWGTALKPAYEPIVLARKPFKGSTEQNHQRHGTGGINVDGGRVQCFDALTAPKSDPSRRRGVVGASWQARSDAERNQKAQADSIRRTVDLGRWPANVCLDEVAAAMLDEQSGELAAGHHPAIRSGKSIWSGDGGGLNGNSGPEQWLDSGGASRFFYVAKPSRAERDMGCHNLPPRQRDDSRKAGDPGGDNPRNRGLQPRGNHHPTVKPIALMRWLVRLVTPAGGTVLDPFTGSGTTGCACAFEGFEFIGIEREAEYVEIAERRIAACLPLFGQAS